MWINLKISRWFNLSLAIHILLLVFAGFILSFTQTSIMLGKESIKMINSYVYEGKALASSKAAESKKIVIEKKTKAEPIKTTVNKLITSSNSLVKKEVVIAHNESLNKATTSKGMAASDLVTLLHAEIQKQQRYPASALQMEREGRVKLAFILYTDGKINNLRVVTSSGTNSLDVAALQAIKDAAPFHSVKKYLQIAQEFSIDVVFSLN